MNKRDKRHAAWLNELGWNVKTQSDLDKARDAFRRGWARYTYDLTKADTKRLNEKRRAQGKKPITLARRVNRAMKKAVELKRAGKPNASRYFSFHEFLCKGGVEKGCRRIYVHRDLLRAMDKHRAALKKPIKVLSGYRCYRHNKRVKGAALSQHRWGRAFDPDGYVGDAAWVKKLKIYRGIGIRKADGSFRHGDVRPGFSLLNPVFWFYGV